MCRSAASTSISSRCNKRGPLQTPPGPQRSFYIGWAKPRYKSKKDRSAIEPVLFGRSVIIGLGKIQSYQWFCMQQARGSYPNFFSKRLVSCDIGQLLLRHPTGFPSFFNGKPYIVKVKSSLISFKLHNITQNDFTFQVLVFERFIKSLY